MLKAIVNFFKNLFGVNSVDTIIKDFEKTKTKLMNLSVKKVNLAADLHKVAAEATKQAEAHAAEADRAAAIAGNLHALTNTNSKQDAGK